MDRRAFGLPQDTGSPGSSGARRSGRASSAAPDTGGTTITALAFAAGAALATAIIGGFYCALRSRALFWRDAERGFWYGVSASITAFAALGTLAFVFLL